MTVNLVTRNVVVARVLRIGEIDHLDAWHLVRNELRDISSPAIVTAFEHFMDMVEGPVEHKYLFARLAADEIRRRMRPPPAPTIVVTLPGRISVSNAFKSGKLLVHMIPRLPGDKKDAWKYDLNLIASKTGYEVCSLSLIHKGDSLYSTAYGLFAVVPEEELLAIGISDLGSNSFRKSHANRGLDHATVKRELQEHLKRTHENHVVGAYNEFAEARLALKARVKASARAASSSTMERVTMNNEIVANLKTEHLIGICVNIAYLASIGKAPSSDKLRKKLKDEISSITEAVFIHTNIRLPTWTYDDRSGTEPVLISD
ncbi:hypothetical protein [Janthinobacterium sp. 1_2014MBL_MicDiv]|uniref:hypothetical protein n=1 Tax=Janthinobacterium sp. 1_2014MBL_MicDiv TaxID=1644131 RepID=UPI0012EB9CE7|nr:hypothetical protein [Janthinobacterium sp. 1_2014MBL_MicDiv]